MLDFGLPYPGNLSPPDGFELIAWDAISPGDEVFIACLDPENPRTMAKGPYLVQKKFLLLDVITKKQVGEPGERILRKIEKPIEKP